MNSNSKLRLRDALTTITREVENISSTYLIVTYCFAECQLHPSIIEYSSAHKAFTINLHRITQFGRQLNDIQKCINRINTKNGIEINDQEFINEIYDISCKFSEASLLNVNLANYNLPVLISLPDIAGRWDLTDTLDSIINELQKIHMRIIALIEFTNRLTPLNSGDFFNLSLPVELNIKPKSRNDLITLLDHSNQVCSSTKI